MNYARSLALCKATGSARRRVHIAQETRLDMSLAGLLIDQCPVHFPTVNKLKDHVGAIPYIVLPRATSPMHISN